MKVEKSLSLDPQTPDEYIGMRGELDEMRHLCEVKMRQGIKPLCPVHHSEMFGPNDEKRERYSCDQHGCNMHWRPQSEYFAQDLRFPVGEQGQDLIPCPRGGHGHMFLSAVDTIKCIEFWECCIEGCDQQLERLMESLDSQMPRLHYYQLLS